MDQQNNEKAGQHTNSLADNMAAKILRAYGEHFVRLANRILEINPSGVRSKQLLADGELLISQAEMIEDGEISAADMVTELNENSSNVIDYAIGKVTLARH